MFKHSLPTISPLSPLSLHFVTRMLALSGLKSYRLLCLLIVFISISTASNAQETIKRPKIGLVLSGGGAKGLAHIGVLKEIEKAGIKIDYIGGTSMGAIVGGLYAAGYTAHELDSIFNGTNFDELLQDFVPRNNKNFYEKANDEVYALTLPFQNLKISVPRGISKGLYNYNLISKLTHNVRYINDFSKLKIPFLCIATNVETGEEVVFKKGSLPLVLTASGAFPSLFSPVEIDGKYYIDGGVTNNYPVEEVRKMGADIIIGVDVQDDLKSSDKIKGATGVLAQISSFQMLEKMKEKKLLTDIYIKPNIDGFSVISFERGEALVSKGVEAAKLVEDKLKALGTNYEPVSMQSKTVDTLNIKAVGVFGLEDYTQSYVLGKLRFKKEKKISYVDLNSGINNLNATQNFSSINYKLVKENETQDNLILEVRENPVKTFIKLGLHYDGLFKSGLLLNITKKNLLFKNDVAAFDLILGDNIRYNLDYYVDNGFHWSFGFKSQFKQFNKNSKTDYYEGKLLQVLGINSINVDYMDLSNQAYLQTIFAQKFLIGAGVEHKYLRISTNSTQIATTYFDRSHYLSAVGFLKYDSFDNKYFPKSGWYFMGDFQSYISSTDYNSNFARFSTFKGDIGIAQRFFKKFSVKLQSEAGFNVDRNKNNVFDYQLGGYGFSKINNIKSFYGYDLLELSGNTYIKGSATLDYEFLKKSHFNFAANYANLGANIFADGDWLSKPKYSGYAVGYGLETYIGPIEIKHSWSPETKDHYTWFSVGFWF